MLVALVSSQLSFTLIFLWLYQVLKRKHTRSVRKLGGFS